MKAPNGNQCLGDLLMKACTRFFAILVCALTVVSCGSSSSSPTSPTPPSSPTRIIGLAGNLTFGNVTVGQSANATLTITNSGNAPLTITGLTVPSGSGSSYVASFTSGIIGAGATQPVTIQFKPVSAATYSGTFTVNGDQTSGTNTMPISGTGVSATPTPPPSAFSINGSVTDGTSTACCQTSLFKSSLERTREGRP